MAGNDMAETSTMMMMMMGMSKRKGRSRTRRKLRCNNKSATISAPTNCLMAATSRNNARKAILASSLLLLLALAEKTLGQSTSSSYMGATNAYGEPIKWSFGGWAPLDGQQQPGKNSSDHNNSRQTTAAMSTRTSTTLKPPPMAQNQTLGSRQLEALSASASQPIQYSQPADAQNNLAFQNKLSPAYAMATSGGLQRPQGGFSPPAPAPILRELPKRRHQRQHSGQHIGSRSHMRAPMRGNTDRYRRPPRPHHQPMMHMLHTQHHVQHLAPEVYQQQQMIMSSAANYQRQMQQQQQHRQRMRHMHHMQQLAARQQHLMMMQQQPHYGPPAQMQMQQMPANFAAGHQQLGAYRLVDGEQPVMFSQPTGQGDIPVLEVSTGGHQNQDQNQNENQNPARNETYEMQQDNLNYQQALSKDQQPPSNNIHDVKQKQIYEAGNASAQQQASGEPAKGSSSYLTIPVAVETDGDKVLTADDINEIEKHVIQVLPNLKTADQIVKVANDGISVANYNGKSSGTVEQPQLGQIMHQLNYNEHQTTMKELEGDLKQQYQQQHAYESSTTAPSSPSSPAYTSQGSHPSTTSSSPSSPSSATHQIGQQKQQSQPEPQVSNEEQYFVATGPLQEVGELDQDQLAEYNLIKNDLLHNFRYEPTRSNSQQQQQQKGSTAPMSAPTPAPPAASVSRYFQQGKQTNVRPANKLNYGGRQTNSYGSYSVRPTTKATMMGRKVSDVMRPLIHTTPVPMTSPLHVPSLEPEKLDAIQLIAGHANDRRPMVVEAHQLVNHTPDGGIDYNSGMVRPAAQNGSSPIIHGTYHEETTADDQQHSSHESAPAVGDHQNQHPGAIIEYVAMNGDGHQNNVAQQQVYEVSGQQQQQQQQPTVTVYGPEYGGASMNVQQQQAGVSHSEPQQLHQTTPYAPESNNQEHLAAWSPNVASEHQQHQQMELSDHAQHMVAELPATAGYNNFFQVDQQQQQEQTASNAAADQQQEHQQPRSWRTKAGGHQPNPDAQYDGQIAKGEQEEQNGQQQEQQQEQQQYQQQSADMDLRPQIAQEPEGHQQQHQQQVDNGGGDNGGYQSQQQQQTTRASADGYQPQHSTNSYVGGAQINHQHSADQGQHEPQYSYMKLDRDRQQSHLQQQQAQHQVQLQELQQQQQPGYQTTTPMAITTAAVEQQQQGDNNGYLGEQSRPSVQSQPEAMMINESPMQMPIMDQQSLIGDANQETNEQLSDDDGAKQRQQPAPAVYQVYQAYYAPKDHKPLPGYVRLSLEEFNNLFRDAEIQYVDRNNIASLVPQQQQPSSNNDENNSNYANHQPEVLRSSASEQQSILVDRRSIDRPEKRSSSGGDGQARQKSLARSDRNRLSFGRAVKKIISIRSARQFEKQFVGTKSMGAQATKNNNLNLNPNLNNSNSNLNAKTTTPAMMTTRPLPVPSATTKSSNQQHKAAQSTTSPSPSKSKTKKPTKTTKESSAANIQIKAHNKLEGEKKTTKVSL